MSDKKTRKELYEAAFKAQRELEEDLAKEKEGNATLSKYVEEELERVNKVFAPHIPYGARMTGENTREQTHAEKIEVMLEALKVSVVEVENVLATMLGMETVEPLKEKEEPRGARPIGVIVSQLPEDLENLRARIGNVYQTLSDLFL